MKQSIRYLYEYENGDRVRNVGFIKVEKQSDKCMINIHGKSLDFGEEKKLEVYVFYMEGERCIGILQGDIGTVSPVINYVLKFEPEDVGGEEAFEKLVGLVLQNGEGKKYAALWTEADVNVGNMQRFTLSEVNSFAEEPEENLKGDVTATEEASIEKVSAEEVSIEEVSAEKDKETADEESDREVVRPARESLIEHVEKLVGEQEAQETAGIVKEEIQENTETVEEIQENTETVEVVEEYIPPKTRTYEKIQRKDLSRLPRKEWRLANNSFLLHGFYNYHHLLYIEEGEYSWIGVPGIFHEKEQAAARAFGFSQFHRITDADIELSAEERNTFDDFGYWCRQVER